MMPLLVQSYFKFTFIQLYFPLLYKVGFLKNILNFRQKETLVGEGRLRPTSPLDERVQNVSSFVTTAVK